MPKPLPLSDAVVSAHSSIDPAAAYEAGIEAALTGCACPWPAGTLPAVYWRDGRQDGLRDLPAVWAGIDMTPPTTVMASDAAEADAKKAAVMAKIRQATRLASGDDRVPAAMIDMIREIESLLRDGPDMAAAVSCPALRGD